MATRQAPTTISVTAGATVNQFRFVVVQTDGKFDQVGSAGGDADGVAQSDASDGDALDMDVAGVTKVECGASVTAADKVQSDDAGKAITAASGDHVLGKALTDGDSGDIIPVLLVSKHILA